MRPGHGSVDHLHPLILHSGAGRSVEIGSGTRCTFKVVGEQTAGRLALFEYQMEPGAPGASPHIHRELTQVFYVVEGEVHLRVGAEETVGRKGSLVLVPPGTVHAFSGSETRRSVALILFCPADRREDYFEGLAEITREGRRATREELVDLMRLYDQEPVGV